MIDLSPACLVHRRALVAFVDRGEVASATERALAHLDRCGRCTDELEATVLTITALRRLGDDAGRLEPSADAWPRLRARLERWRPARWSIMSPAAGAAMSLALVAALVAPLGIVSGPPDPVPGPTTSPDSLVLEERFVTAGRHGPLADRLIVRLDGDDIFSFPDGIQPQQKEVATRVSGRLVTPS